MNHSTRKKTVSKLKKRNIVCSDITKAARGHRGINFLNDYDEADEEEQRWLSCNIQMKLWEKANIGSFRHHKNCGSTHPLMAMSRENKSQPSFLDFKSQRWIQPWWDLKNRQWWTVIKQLGKCLSSLAAQSVFLISKRQYDSKNTDFCWLL